MQQPTREPSHKRASGFTLIELLVAMAVMAEVMAVAYVLFDVNTRIGRTQVQVAELQQSQRIAQYDVLRTARMAGRGGLPQNLALNVRNNVADNTKIVDDGSSPIVVEGTDIFSIRGVFSTPVYQVGLPEGAASNLVVDNAADPTSGSLIIAEMSSEQIPQSIDVLDAIGDRPEPMIMMSEQSDLVFAIVEVTDVTINAGTPRTARIDFKVKGSKYEGLTPWPEKLTKVAYAGIIEEYRYYVRREFEVPGDETSLPAPKLARARVYLGTDTVWDGDVANAEVDVADNILDLQVALGFDLDANDIIDGPVGAEATDEWRYNDSGDNPNDVIWNNGELFYARITTLAQTDRRDASYQDEAIEAIEDHDYNEPTTAGSFQEELERQHRRRQMASVVDLRNIG